MEDATLGFIGLGVMGGPMCRNLVSRSGRPVVAFDLHKSPPEGALAARSAAEVSARADIVFLSLPGEAQIREVCAALDTDKTVVDCSTAPVSLGSLQSALRTSPTRRWHAPARLRSTAH